MPFDGTQLNETARHLLRAKNLLEKRGWCPTGPLGEGGQVCMVQAIRETMERNGPNRAGYYMGIAIGVEPSYVDGHSIGKWNDTPGRTLVEVLAAFDKAVILAIDS